MSTTTTTAHAALLTTSPRGEEIAARLGLVAAGEAIGPEVRQVVIWVDAPEDAPLVQTSDDDLAALVDRLRDAVRPTQAATAHFQAAGTEGATIAALLPGDTALGRAGASLPGALVDGLMSFFRTIAIELRKEGIALNVIFYDTLDEVDTAAISALLAAYRSAPSITGQEVFTGSGPNLGKVKP